jgi:hypothetical protein
MMLKVLNGGGGAKFSPSFFWDKLVKNLHALVLQVQKSSKVSNIQ